jgi:hypothetical protein
VQGSSSVVKTTMDPKQLPPPPRLPCGLPAQPLHRKSHGVCAATVTPPPLASTARQAKCARSGQHLVSFQKVGQRGSAPLAKRRLHPPNRTMRNTLCAIVQTTQQHWAADFRVGALSWCGSCKPFLPLTESLICLLFARDRTRAGTRTSMDLSSEPAPPLSSPPRCRPPVQRKRADSVVRLAHRDDDQLRHNMTEY